MNIDEVVDYLKANNQDIRPLFTHSITKGSSKEVEWLCPCGNKFLRSPYSVFRNCDVDKKSCGKCNTIDIEQVNQILLALGSSLSPLFTHSVSKGSSKKKVDWLCKCGNTHKATVYYVLNGRIVTCGRCNELTYEEVIQKLKDTGSDLIIDKFEGVISTGSSEKIELTCSCGNKFYRIINDVFRDDPIRRVKTCGKCNIVTLEEINEILLNLGSSITPAFTDPVSKGSTTKVEWFCGCGKEYYASPYNVLKGKVITCDKCNSLTYGEIMSLLESMGSKLSIKPYEGTICFGSGDKHEFMCRCGTIFQTNLHSVYRGITKSCSKCKLAALNWYDKNKQSIAQLKFPITPEQFPSGGPIPLEIIKDINYCFDAQCQMCDKIYKNSVKKFKVTCGCVNGQISYAQKEIFDYIISLGVDAKLEYGINKLKYDIGIPNKKLVIEFNGIKWHAMPKSKGKDLRKYENAITNGYEMLTIFEDEWMFKKFQMKNLIIGRLFDKLNDQEIYQIHAIDSEEASKFYEQFHCVGAYDSEVSYGMFHDSKLVACISLNKQLDDCWELNQFIMDASCKIHKVLNRLFESFITECNPKFVTVLSDNRQDSDKVYEELGFVFDEAIPSDWYWVKWPRRFNKTTELSKVQFGKAKKSMQIWDLGKKRWVLSFKS
jgi:hypothetical protein